MQKISNLIISYRSHTRRLLKYLLFQNRTILDVLYNGNKCQHSKKFPVFPSLMLLSIIVSRLQCMDQIHNNNRFFKLIRLVQKSLEMYIRKSFLCPSSPITPYPLVVCFVPFPYLCRIIHTKCSRATYPLRRELFLIAVTIKKKLKINLFI